MEIIVFVVIAMVLIVTGTLLTIIRIIKTRHLQSTKKRGRRKWENFGDCYVCGGWDQTGGDCYRINCIHNRCKYGDKPGALDLWPHGEFSKANIASKVSKNGFKTQSSDGEPISSIYTDRRHNRLYENINDCCECDGWDGAAGDCYISECIHNSCKYGDVPGMRNLWPHGDPHRIGRWGIRRMGLEDYDLDI